MPGLLQINKGPRGPGPKKPWLVGQGMVGVRFGAYSLVKSKVSMSGAPREGFSFTNTRYTPLRPV